jgi:hypothetical protein
MEGFEAHHGVRDFLDEAMILRNPVIQLFNLADFNEAD